MTDSVLCALKASLYMCFILELFSVVINEIFLSLLCRLIILFIIVIVYDYQVRFTNILLGNDTNNNNNNNVRRNNDNLEEDSLVREDNSIIFTFCLLTIPIQLFIFFLSPIVYHLIVIILSGIILVEEFLRIKWLWAIQRDRKYTQIIIERPTYERESLYRRLFNFFRLSL